MKTFFLVIPPGLEELAALELNQKVPGISIIKIEKGGLTLEAPLELGFSLNLILKIPTEIRLRIAEFKCRDLPKLYQKISNIKWADYLVGSEFSLSVASSKSRLLNEKKIANSVKEGILRHFQKQPAKKSEKKFAFEISVRFFNDICTISLNISGEPLFKRGYKKMSAVAPIRENLAAALYFALLDTAGPFDTLIDPMCGSGTFLLEAQNFWQLNKQRDFAFCNKHGWAITEIIIEGFTPTIFYGFDKNPKVLQDLEESLGNISIATRANWHITTHDILTDEPIRILSQSCAVICNPPYGERLKLPKAPKEYYLNLLEQLIKFNPKGVGIILPQRFASLVSGQISGYTVAKKWKFTNGGLPVEFRVYKH